jgi:hypothetical protein
MVFAFHSNDEKYFRVLYENSKNNLVPYVYGFFSSGFKGELVIAFPPWSMPFGGYQQGAKSWWLSRRVFIHLLPRPIYLSLFKILDQDKDFIAFMKETKDRGSSIESFENMIVNTNLKIIKRHHFFVVPIYEIEFKLKPRLLWTWLNNTLLTRKFYTTSSHYLF